MDRDSDLRNLELQQQGTGFKHPSFFVSKLRDYSFCLLIAFPAWLLIEVLLVYLPLKQSLLDFFRNLTEQPLAIASCVIASVLGALGLVIEYCLRRKLPPSRTELGSDIRHGLYRNGILSVNPDEWEQQLKLKFKTKKRKPNKVVQIFISIPAAKTQQIKDIFNGTRISRNVKQMEIEELHGAMFDYCLTLEFFNWKEAWQNG